MAKQKIEKWEQELINQANAIRQMREHGLGPAVQGARIAGSKRAQQTQVANVRNRDKAAIHVGFAPDRTHG